MATSLTREEILAAIPGTRGVVKEVAENLGVSRAALYNALKEYPEIMKGPIHQEREGLIDDAETKLAEKIDKGDITALIFFLKTRGKNRGYVERLEALEGVPITTLVTLVKTLERNQLNPQIVIEGFIAEAESKEAKQQMALDSNITVVDADFVEVSNE